MSSIDEALSDELENWRQAGLLRTLRTLDHTSGTRATIGTRELLNFSSNDYLGLARHPELQEAATRALQQHGVGSTASRLVSGTTLPHKELESAIAAWKGTPAALTFSSGHAAAMGTLAAILTPDDIVILDKRSHACCIDGARLSNARLRVFPHNDLNRLESLLKWSDAQQGKRRPRVLVVTESVFSMDGDRAPLNELVALKERYGAWLLLDEAHATGLFGASRSGLAAAHQLTDRIEIHLGTLSKSLGCSGGYIAGSQTLIDFLVNRARSFIYSTAPPPSIAAAAAKAVEIVQSDEGRLRCEQTWANAHRLDRWLAGHPLASSPTPPPTTQKQVPQSGAREPASAIFTWITGSESATLSAAEHLLEHGILCPAIRHPSVPRGAARLRLTVTAGHSPADMTQLEAALESSIKGSLQDPSHHA